MSNHNGLMVVGPELTVKADIRNCRRLEVYGYVEGDIAAEEVSVGPGGRLCGRLRADHVDVLGIVEGDVAVRHLITIRGSGNVSGDVQYGRMSLEAGGSLSASVRNVPPHLAGDFEMTVVRGGSVVITPEDLRAIDPDDAARHLVYTPGNLRGGHLALVEAPAVTLQTFTQADLDRRAVAFVHDGSAGRDAGFEVVVRDAEGATSGAPRRVHVSVRDAVAA